MLYTIYFLISFAGRTEIKDVQQVETKQPEPIQKSRPEPQTKKKPSDLPLDVTKSLPETPLPEKKKDTPVSIEDRNADWERKSRLHLVEGLALLEQGKWPDALLNGKWDDAGKEIAYAFADVPRSLTAPQQELMLEICERLTAISLVMKNDKAAERYLTLVSYYRRDLGWNIEKYNEWQKPIFIDTCVRMGVRDASSSSSAPSSQPKEAVTFTRPVEPKPSKPVVTIEVASTPPINLAPAPRQVVWTPPLSGYSSEWQKTGAIDVRVAGLSIAKVPIIDAKERIEESERPMLVVIVEVRKNTPGKKRTFRPFSLYGTHSGRIFDANFQELLPQEIPLGKKLDAGVPRSQLLPDDGTPVRDVLLFEVPADSVGNLDLRLDSERCDESGDIWFKIPSLAWKMKQAGLTK